MRRGLLAFLGLLAAGGGALAFLEWSRPRVDLANETASSVAVISDGAQSAQLPALSSPQVFGSFVQQLRSNYQAMHDRYRTFRHRERITEEEIGPEGNGIHRRDHEEEVWFVDGEEHRRAILEDGSEASETIIPQSPPMAKNIYPFYAEDQPGFYRYEFAGYEVIEGEALARIRFEPKEPTDGKLRGSVWVEPQSAQPRRFDGVLASPPVFLDGFRMTAEYGPSENGHFQLRRMTTDGAGGFAFVRKRFRKDVQYRDYAPTLPRCEISH